MKLKELSRQQQLEYTSNLLFLLKDMKSNAHTSDWSNVIALRQNYDLTPYSKEQLRRNILLNELLDADVLTTSKAVNDLTKDAVHELIVDINKKPGTFKQTYDCASNKSTSEAILPLSDSDLDSPENLLIAHKFNPEKFKLLRVRNTLYQSALKDGAKNLYSSKIEVEPIYSNSLTKEDFKKVFEELLAMKDNTKQKEECEEKEVQKKFANYKYDTNCLVLYTPDLHFGRASNSIDTGIDWNLDLAIEQAKNNILSVVSKMFDKKLEQIVYVINSDAINSEYTKFTTSGRHLQDNSNSASEIYKTVAQFFIFAIQQLSKLAPVKVISIPGNHAGSYEFTLGLLLYAYFHDEKGISFDVDAMPRKAFIYGENLLTFTHGDKEGKRLKDIIPNEFSAYWGRTKNHFLFTAHLHHMMWEETENGLEIITLNSATYNDKYTNDKGFKSKNRISAFLFNKKGLEETIFINN